MDKVDNRARFVEIFLREWGMYRASGPVARASRRALRVCANSLRPFEREVQAGDVRVFADFERPVLGLLLLDQGADGRLVVPVSDFSVPATEQEILVGTRVYRLWACRTLSRETVERGWKVETVSAEDRKSVLDATRAVLLGDPLPEDLAGCTAYPVVSSDDPRLDYEESMDVAPVITRETGSSVNGIRPRLGRSASLWVFLAACLCLACSAFFLFPRGGQNDEEGTGQGQVVEVLTPEQLLEVIENALEVESLSILQDHAGQVLDCEDVEVRQNFVDALSWFGAEAIPDLLSFLDDSTDDVRSSALTAWTSAIGMLDDDEDKVAAIELAFVTVQSADSLEQISLEYNMIDEKVAVRSLLRAIDLCDRDGCAREARRIAVQIYGEITGEAYVDSASAQAWLLKGE